MKILFVMEQRVNAGSIQAVANYVRAGNEVGHEIAMFGRPDPQFPLMRWSMDPSRFDYVIFILESRLNWLTGLRLSPLLNQVPRRRRAILDADGMYNRVLSVNGYDRNHATEQDRERWLLVYRELTDKVLQPTPRPLETDVMPLPFYGYDPQSEVPSHTTPKPFDIIHVGHNWWRWEEIGTRVLPALQKIRNQVGKICFFGLWWDAQPSWAAAIGLQQAFQLDVEWFRRLEIDVHPPVAYTKVIATMSQARINLMTQRPLFRQLKLWTSKYFEILCADTVPLIMLSPRDAECVYGAAGRELVLDEHLEDKLLDVLEHPATYREIVNDVRAHVTRHHSYRQRVQELVSALAD